MRGWPAAGEDVIVARNILLAELTDWWIHCQHVSSARVGGVDPRGEEARREDFRRSVPASFHADRRVPEDLRHEFQDEPAVAHGARPRGALGGLADGTIDCIASDHAPHCTYEKEVEFDIAPFGIIGLETELALSLELVRKKVLTLPQLVEKFTVNPARLSRLNKGTLSAGADADITIIDLDREWTYDVDQSASKSRNSPFHGWKLKGKAVVTIVGGKIVWREE